MLNEFKKFCDQLHQDISAEFGKSVIGITYGVAATTLSIESSRKLTSELENEARSECFTRLLEVCRSHGCYQIISENSPKEDLNEIIYSLHTYIRDEEAKPISRDSMREFQLDLKMRIRAAIVRSSIGR
jgi:hypothetical protein